MHFPNGNHPCAGFSSNQDAFPRCKSSLHRNFFKSGCIPPLKIIPAQNFLQIRMNCPAGNHPCAEFSSNLDAFPRWKSSLPDIFFKSGWIAPLEIIPTQKFLQIRMHFSDENHPYTEISSNQDAFFRSESSLHRIFFQSGWIPPLKIIPVMKWPLSRSD